MDLGLRGKTALVTAATKGIGKQCALSLAAEGANVVICGRDENRLRTTARELAAVPQAGGILAERADLAASDDIARLCRAAADRFGGVDILVLLGGSPKRGGFNDITVDDLRDAYEVTVIATFRLLKELVPGMRQRKWGRIVTVQSRAIREPIPELVTSVATRPGVAGLLKYVSNEVAADGVLINTIVPGRINTDRFQQGVNQSPIGAENYVRKKLGDIPVGRLGEPEEIASAVCFLVSEKASYINGAALQIDGGVIRAF